MPVFHSKYFGPVSFAPEAALEFPLGLPGFEERRRFVALQDAGTAPLVFVQSLEETSLCFLSLPVLAVDPAYRLSLSEEDRRALELPEDLRPEIGRDVLCLAVLSLRENGPTANLLAPIVVNLQNRKAVQAVCAGSGYSHQQELVAEEAPVCS